MKKFVLMFSFTVLCSKNLQSMAETKGRKIYVLTSNCKIIGTWSNLRHLCVELKEKGFPSYSKLSKTVALLRKDGNETPEIDVSMKDGQPYQIKVEILK
jgi:hypothetical protein